MSMMHIHHRCARPTLLLAVLTISPACGSDSKSSKSSTDEPQGGAAGSSAGAGGRSGSSGSSGSGAVAAGGTTGGSGVGTGGAGIGGAGSGGAAGAAGAAGTGVKPSSLTSLHCGNTAAYPVGTEVFVAGGGTEGRVASSLDGESWLDETTMTRGPTDVGHTRNLIRGVGYGAGVFVAVGGYDNAYISTSCDGVSWRHDVGNTNQEGPPQAPYDNFLESVAGLDQVLLAVGGAALRLTSSDHGVSWQSTGDYFEGHLRAVAVGNGSAVAVGHRWDGDVGISTTTTDGQSWTPMYEHGSTGFFHVPFGNGVFVALGLTNCSTSLQGSSWVPCDINTASDFSDVRFMDGKFWVQLTDGTIVTSTDATSWTAATVGWLKLASVGGTERFVMVDVSSRGYSFDAANWQEFPMVGLDNLTVGTIRYQPTD